MRTALFLTLVAALPACSLFSEVDPGSLSFRTVATATVGGWPPTALAVARTAAEAEALADAFGLDATPTADFATEALVAVSTYGACPATNYAVRVDHIEVYPTRTRVSASVEETDAFPGRELAHPVAVVAVPGLGPAAPTLDLRGAADVCTLE